MALNGAERLLYDMVKNQLTDSATMEDIELLVGGVAAAVNLEPQSVRQVIEAFRSERTPKSSDDFVPRLLVDWGEIPRVGYQVRPEFTLVCPAYESRPEIDVTIDSDLDASHSNPRRKLQPDGQSIWSFHVPFSLTTRGLDCRPGQYLIEVEISFRDVPPSLPHFYRCRIRLTVPAVHSDSNGVLEIDGDGQSIVNLQGYNLRQFSKVVLKGGKDSIINLAHGLKSEASDGLPVTEKPVTTFEYRLKTDCQKQARLPRLLRTDRPRAYLDAGGWFFNDGRRCLVYARPRLTFGRSRDNDVVVRFLPRNDENDRYSRTVSRTHFIAELTPEGIELRDESQSGVELNYSVVQGRAVISAAIAGEINHVELGVTGTVAKKFEFEVVIFSPHDGEDRDERQYWAELTCAVVGGKLSRIARDALDASINCVRYDRVNNLADDESYVHLLREALIGGSPAQAGILLKECDGQAQARLLHIDRSFWLEPLPGSLPILIDGIHVPPLSLVCLCPGMELTFGNEGVRFANPTQLFLD